MRSKNYLLHIYKKDVYKGALVFESRTKLTTFLRSRGGVFGTKKLTDIGDGLVLIPAKGLYKFEVEELVS
jgi:hypothetical protein